MGKQQFWGEVSGRATTCASRGGSKASGLTTEAAGWRGMIEVRLWHTRDGKDMFSVYLKPHWSDSGEVTKLAEGLLDHRVGPESFLVPALVA